MHVLQVASGDFFSTYGGGQIYVKNLVDEMLRQAAVKVSVLSLTGSEEMQVREYNGCTIYEVGILSDETLVGLLKKTTPDVVHAHSHKPQVCRVAKSLGIPVVVTAHHGGIICPAGAFMNCNDEICRANVSHRNCLKCTLRRTRSGLWWYPLMRLLPEALYVSLGNYLDRQPVIYFVTPIGKTALHIWQVRKAWQVIVNDCSKMIAPSDGIRDAMIRNGLPENKVVVLPHGIPLPKQVLPYPSANGGIRFFYVGRICYIKGVHVMLEAFHQLTDSKTELHLIGNGAIKSERRYEKKLQEKYKDDPRIVWHGKVPPDRVAEVTRDFHVSVSPSICLEIFGLNIAEALAAGKPVLASRNGGAEMQIRDGVNGWLVSANDVKAMAAAMERIVNLPDTLPAMSSRCHSYSITDHCRKLIEIYSQLNSSN